MFALKKIIGAAALALFALHAQAVPTLSFSTPTVTNGTAVDVDVVVTDIADLFGYNVSINFDPALLQLGSVSTGAFLGTAGTPDFGIVDANGTPGLVFYVYDTLWGTGPGASGSGTLFSLHFETLGAGLAAFSFADLLFFDSNLDTIAVSATPGALTILPVITPPGGEVPEPASALLLAAGAAALIGRRRRASAGRA